VAEVQVVLEIESTVDDFDETKRHSLILALSNITGVPASLIRLTVEAGSIKVTATFLPAATATTPDGDTASAAVTTIDAIQASIQTTYEDGSLARQAGITLTPGSPPQVTVAYVPATKSRSAVALVLVMLLVSPAIVILIYAVLKISKRTTSPKLLAFDTDSLMELEDKSMARMSSQYQQQQRELNDPSRGFTNMAAV